MTAYPNQIAGRWIAALALALLTGTDAILHPAGAQNQKSQVWKPVPFAIVKYNDEAPKAWNIYHSGKRGYLLVQLWKRFLFVDLQEQQVYDVDPDKLKHNGDNIEWSAADLSDQTVDIADWKQRDVGTLQRIRFRLGKNGHILELQIPLRPDGKTLY
jgi:hypothetical protein